MIWPTDNRGESQNTQKRWPNVSASFLTSTPRSLLVILVLESLNPLFSSKTDSKEQNSFSPSTVLPLLYTSVKTGCLE